MPVVIQEFEVVPETAPPSQETNAARGGQTEGAKKKERLHPEDFVRLLHERAERVRAH